MQDCLAFLIEANPAAVEAAAREIKRHLNLLVTFPQIGVKDQEDFGFYDLIIPFSKHGYVARYFYHIDSDELVVTAFRHQREAGFD